MVLQPAGRRRINPLKLKKATEEKIEGESEKRYI
jgi:hypothetical protein